MYSDGAEVAMNIAKACISVRATLPYALNVFEGAQLTQLVQLVTAGRLFLGHKVSGVQPTTYWH